MTRTMLVQRWRRMTTSCPSKTRRPSGTRGRGAATSARPASRKTIIATANKIRIDDRFLGKPNNQYSNQIMDDIYFIHNLPTNSS